VIGTHQDLSGPVQGWACRFSTDENGGSRKNQCRRRINGPKSNLIVKTAAYDPNGRCLASAKKMVSATRFFAMVCPMGSPTVLAAQDILFDGAVLQLFR